MREVPGSIPGSGRVITFLFPPSSFFFSIFLTFWALDLRVLTYSSRISTKDIGIPLQIIAHDERVAIVRDHVAAEYLPACYPQ